MCVCLLWCVSVSLWCVCVGELTGIVRRVIDMSGSGVREATGVVQQGISAPTLHVGAPTVLASTMSLFFIILYRCVCVSDSFDL